MFGGCGGDDSAHRRGASEENDVKLVFKESGSAMTIALHNLQQEGGVRQEKEGIRMPGCILGPCAF